MSIPDDVFQQGRQNNVAATFLRGDIYEQRIVGRANRLCFI